MAKVEGASATRSTIVRAAEQIFGERGYSKTALEDVAVAAGVSRPLVYRYFGEKRELFAVVVQRVLQEWHDRLAAEVAKNTPGTAHTLRLVLTACLDFAHSRTVLRGLLVRDARLVRSEIGNVLDEGRSLLPKLIQRVLERGVERGDVRSDLAVEDMADVVSEVFVSYTLPVLSGVDDGVDQRRVEAVVETLLHGVIASGPQRTSARA